MRQEAAQKKFRDKQVKVEADMQDWAEHKKKKHDAFSKNFQDTSDNGKKLLKERSKSCGDISKKAKEKFQTNHNRLAAEQNKSNNALMDSHEAARIRCEERSAMKLKCDNDIHSFRAVKDGTWGELVRKRQQEHKKSIDANCQALVIRIGEQCAARAAQTEAQGNLAKQRQSMAGELLKQQNLSEEAFIKIKCEPDPMKIHKVMSDLGFEMPALPGKEKKGEEEDEKKR